MGCRLQPSERRMQGPTPQTPNPQIWSPTNSGEAAPLIGLVRLKKVLLESEDPISPFFKSQRKMHQREGNRRGARPLNFQRPQGPNPPGSAPYPGTPEAPEAPSQRQTARFRIIVFPVSIMRSVWVESIPEAGLMLFAASRSGTLF